MGICHSSNIALHHYNLKPFRSVLDELHFNDAEGNNLYHMFRQCDRDGSGEINIMEMLTFFGKESCSRARVYPTQIVTRFREKQFYQTSFLDF